MRKLLLALPFLLVPSFAHGQATVNIAPYFYTSLGYCQITTLTSATTLVTASCATGAVPTLNSKVIAQICVETASVRYRDDGTAPTAAIGIPAAAGTCFQYTGPLNAIQFIQQASGAILDVGFYK